MVLNFITGTGSSLTSATGVSISTASAIDIRLSPLQHAFMDYVQVQPTPGIVQQHFQSLQQQQQQQQQAAQVAAVAPSANPQPAEQAATRESNMQGDGQAQAFQ